MNEKQQLRTIANHVFKALESFQDLDISLTKLASSSEPENPTNSIDFKTQLENDFLRFKMWAGNQAAHQTGPSSLDHRLREAPHLHEQVIYLLKDICESLQDAISIASEDFPSLDPDGLGGENQEKQNTEPSSHSLNDDDDDDSDFSDLDSNTSPSSSLSTLFADVGEAVDCLLRLSVAIANPAPHERFRKLGAGLDEDVSFYEPHDIAYVKDKFPHIDDSLAKILGKFITRRRQFFKYRRAHHTRLASNLESDEKADTSRTEIVQKTVASSLPEQFKAMANFDPRANIIDEDVRSDTGVSQTSYATSAGFLIDDQGGQARDFPPPLRVPPIPNAGEDGIFECPFCYRMIAAKSRAAWKYHWSSWNCPFKCEGSFPSAAELSRHVKDKHLPNGDEQELETVVSLGKKTASADIINQCPVCGSVVSGLKNYIKHVGRHLEQLGLFALPSLEEQNPAEDVASDEQISAQSSLDMGSQSFSQAVSLASEEERISLQGEEEEEEVEEDRPSMGDNSRIQIPNLRPPLVLTLGQHPLDKLLQSVVPPDWRLPREDSSCEDSGAIEGVATIPDISIIKQDRAIIVRDKLDWFTSQVDSIMAPKMETVAGLDLELRRLQSTPGEGPLQEHILRICEQTVQVLRQVVDELKMFTGSHGLSELSPEEATLILETLTEPRKKLKSTLEDAELRLGLAKAIGMDQTETSLAEDAIERSAKLKDLEGDPLSGFKDEQAVIKFEDAVGRKFIFPFHIVRTWTGMRELIEHAFIKVNVLGPRVMEGQYDLIGPNMEIILPSIWEQVIQPDWAVTMTMWPMEQNISGKAE
ncbi:hypothetical protein HG530_007717 [Fusarium avenaceum]|nr:hypothetical protein HG530_007717 [Fusarium avenaceum]